MMMCCVCDARPKHLYSHLPLRYSLADEEHCSSTPATLAAACDTRYDVSSSKESEETHALDPAPGSSPPHPGRPRRSTLALVSSLVFLLAVLPALFLLAVLPALLRRAITHTRGVPVILIELVVNLVKELVLLIERFVKELVLLIELVVNLKT